MFNHLNEKLVALTDGPLHVAQDPFAEAASDRIPELVGATPPEAVTAMILRAVGLEVPPTLDTEPTSER